MDFIDRRVDAEIALRADVISESPAAHRQNTRTGCDLVSLAEVEESIATFGQRYLQKVFTEAEIQHCVGGQKLAGLAARFAAKEAVIKAFAIPSAAFPLREIEVTKTGVLPSLRLHGTTAELANQQRWESVSISLSHSDCHALATVFVLCNL